MVSKNPFQENKGMITEDERKAIREGKLLSKLADDPAFQRYVEILKSQIMARQSVVTMPALTIEKWVAQETVKGALGALVLAVNLVPDTIQTAKELAARHGIEFDGETPTE